MQTVENGTTPQTPRQSISMPPLSAAAVRRRRNRVGQCSQHTRAMHWAVERMALDDIWLGRWSSRARVIGETVDAVRASVLRDLREKPWNLPQADPATEAPGHRPALPGEG